ncbi:hypothetical protein I7I51_05812 [Histoplasma capsulatum]|uniref:Uncharacterized protein n=1 Tax=Ajellomyces capsulatus TaxID=5037 RepID=A0A8A1M5R9_AJECA|nr:hypothetical protein I7I51_05812 [Histoplasma capsulatum]
MGAAKVQIARHSSQLSCLQCRVFEDRIRIGISNEISLFWPRPQPVQTAGACWRMNKRIWYGIMLHPRTFASWFAGRNLCVNELLHRGAGWIPTELATKPPKDTDARRRDFGFKIYSPRL